MTNSSGRPLKRLDFAEALKVGVSRVSQLKRLGMPMDSVDAAVAWYQDTVTRREPRVGVTVDGRQKSLTELRCEKLILEIEKGRIDAGLRTKDLIPVESVKATLAVVVDVLRKGYRSGGDWCAVRFALSPRERQEVSAKFDNIERANADQLRQLLES